MSGPWIAAVVVLWILAIALAIVVTGLLRRIAPVLEKAERLFAGLPREFEPGGLEVGSPIPTFSARTVDGVAFTDKEIRERESVIIFFERECRACQALETDLRLADVAAFEVPIYVIVSHSDEAASLEALGVTLVIDEHGFAKQAFQSKASPHAFALGADGTVKGSGTPNTLDGLRQLVHELRPGGDLSADKRIAVSI